MFDKATRLKCRFDSSKGPLSTEDLWDLPLQSTRGPSLDGIAIALSKQLKESGQESFVSAATPANEELKLKLDVVKHIIATRMADNATSLASAAKRAQKEKLMEVLARKQDQSLEQKSEAEIAEMIAAM